MVERGIAYNINLEKDKSPLYRRRQIETHIGERLNTLLSRTEYKLKDGQIFGKGENEPFINVIKAGVGHGNPEDRLREESEIIGFSKIEKVLGDPNVPVETMMVSVSPKGKEGSLYQHNFYDVFTKKDDQIEARRYSSDLNWQEFGNLAQEIGFEGQVSDVSFLSNPIIINDSRFKTPDQIHQFFHRKHEYLSEEDYLSILRICLPSIFYYAENPSEQAFNAVLNKADHIRENFEEIRNGRLDYLDVATKYTTDFWGRLPVRQTMTGCGLSGGSALSETPFSVSDLAQDKHGPRKFDCPDCGRTNIRPKDQLIANCQHCGSSKVAC